MRHAQGAESNSNPGLSDAKAHPSLLVIHPPFPSTISLPPIHFLFSSTYSPAHPPAYPPTPSICHIPTPRSSALLLTYLPIHQSTHPSAHLSLYPPPSLLLPILPLKTHSYPPTPSAFPSILPLTYPQPSPPPASAPPIQLLPTHVPINLPIILCIPRPRRPPIPLMVTQALLWARRCSRC